MSAESSTPPEQPAPQADDSRAVPSTSAEPATPHLDRDGRERPAFLLSLPRDPQLDTLAAAFEAGNFAQVRKEAPRLAASTADPAVRAAALELRRRIDPEPTVVVLLFFAFALLGFVALWTYL